MKKFLIGIVMIIPLLVVATVLISTNVISVNGSLSVDKIKIYDSYTGDILNDKTIDIDLVPGKSDTYLNLRAKALPTCAKNTDLIWSIEDSTCSFAGYDKNYPIASINQKGEIKITGHGSFYAVASSVDGNIRSNVHFRVTGNKVLKVNIFVGSKKADKINMAIRDKLALTAVVVPTNERTNTAVKWSSRSSDESVVFVDQNGIISSRSAGNATIFATSEDNGVVDSIDIKVEENIKFKENYYTSSNKVLLSNIANEFENIAIIDADTAEIIDGILYMNDDFHVKLSIPTSNGDKITTISKCDADDIVFNNIDLIKENYAPGYLITGQKLSLMAVFKDDFRTDFPSNVKYSSSDENLLKIDENGNLEVIGKHSEVTIYAEYNGKEISWGPIAVKKPISFVELDLSEVNDKNGIMEERVYGTRWYEKGKYTTEYEIKIKTPVEPNYNDFNFMVIYPEGYPELAQFSDPNRPNVLIVNDEIHFEGKLNFKIVVSPKATPYKNLKVFDSYSFKFADGTNIVDEKNSYKDLIDINNKEEALVLQTDIPIPMYTNGPLIKNNLYGNGYRVYVDLLDNNINRTSYSVLRIGKNDIVIENAWIIHGIMQENTDLYDFSNCRFGVNLTNIDNATVRFCRIENTGNCVGFDDSGGVVEGCILRNSPMSAVNIYRYRGKGYEVTLKNNVISDCAGVGLSYLVDFNYSYDDKDGKIKHLKTGEVKEIDDYKINIKGFLDTYNWHNESTVNIFQINDKLFDPVWAHFFNDLINNSLIQELKKPENSHIKYSIKPEGETEYKDYWHFAIMIMGINVPVQKDMIQGFEEAGYIENEFILPSILQATPYKYPFYLYSYNKDTFTIGPDDEVDPADFTANSKIYKQLREGRNIG